MDIADNANHHPSFRVALVLIGSNVGDHLSDRVFACELARCQRLINDGDAQRARLILFGEVTTLVQRNLDGLELFRCDTAYVGRGLSSRIRLGMAFNPEVTSDIASAERHRRNKPHALDSWQCFEPFERLIHIPDSFV